MSFQILPLPFSANPRPRRALARSRSPSQPRCIAALVVRPPHALAAPFIGTMFFRFPAGTIFQNRAASAGRTRLR